MFGDMSPLCNGPSVIYHSLPSLQRRLDLDERKEYEDDLVWGIKDFFFFFFSGRDNAIQPVQHTNTFWTPLCEFESAFLHYFSVRSKNQSSQAAVMWLSKIISRKSAPSSFCFSPKAENSSDSDLILIANLPHASIASVLCSPHVTVHDNCFVAQHDREPETKQLFLEDFIFIRPKTEPRSLRQQNVSSCRQSDWIRIYRPQTKQAWEDAQNVRNHSWASPDVILCLRRDSFFVFFNNSRRGVLWLALSWWISFKRRWQQAEGDNDKNLIHMYKEMFAVCVGVILDNMIQWCNTGRQTHEEVQMGLMVKTHSFKYAFFFLSLDF